jgi:hypothetical protein
MRSSALRPLARSDLSALTPIDADRSGGPIFIARTADGKDYSPIDASPR